MSSQVGEPACRERGWVGLVWTGTMAMESPDGLGGWRPGCLKTGGKGAPWVDGRLREVSTPLLSVRDSTISNLQEHCAQWDVDEGRMRALAQLQGETCQGSALGQERKGLRVCWNVEGATLPDSSGEEDLLGEVLGCSSPRPGNSTQEKSES